MKPYIEVEVKFKVDDFGTVRQKLAELGAKKIGQAFQRGINFDFADHSLKNSGFTLRVRSGFRGEVTFKGKAAKTAYSKAREEIETEVAQPDKVIKIFEAIGLKPDIIIEKKRESWQLNGMEIELDELPFGKYVEFEGEEKRSLELAQKLGFDVNKGIPHSYRRLYEMWCQERDIEPGNITFD